MIESVKEPCSPEELKAILHPTINKWFFSRFKEFSLPQLYGVMEIHKGNNILVSAPTGATKTLTAFLAILNELIELAEKNELENRVYCIYISPLKALSRDIEVNLKQPLKEIEAIAAKEFGIRVGLRTGDTTQAERAKMLKEPPHILITTPESFALLLSSTRFCKHIEKIKWLIVDEIHALAENKRGTHLSLSMERLSRINNYCRIGLSATISPLEEVAKFLVGSERACKIVNAQFIKDMDLKVLSPLPDLINTTYNDIQNALYELIDKLVEEHKTTLIFTNTRSATERLVHHLKEHYPKKYMDNIGAHHGSLSKNLRHNIENKLRNGELKVVVSSTSLELGLDIGFIDLVILLGSPKSVARCLQRIGRSGHKLHETSKGRIIVLDRDDLVECSVLLKNAVEKKLDDIHIPKNCLDVLAQQIHGIAAFEQIDMNELFSLIKKSYCYSELEKDDFMSVVSYLAGEFASLEDRHVYAKIWYDHDSGLVGKKGRLSRVLHVTNIGTIPDESHIKVKINDQVIGSIDEAFLERLKRGDLFVLGGDVYEFKFSRGQTTQVVAASGKKPTVPSWFSDMLPLSFNLALEIQRFRRLVEDYMKLDKSKQEVISFINNYLYVDENAACAIYEYFNEQYMFSKIPHDKKIIVEFYSGDKKYAIFHTLYGRRVNDCLSRALAYIIGKLQHRDVEIGINDNGFYLASKKDMQVQRAFRFLKGNDIMKLLVASIDRSEVLKRRFRHCACRALMILRNYKGETKTVGRQQVSSMILLNAVKRLENFPILKEARREVLEDAMDIESTRRVLKEIEEGKITVKEVHTDIPSPFSFELIMQGYNDIIKIEDKIEFLKRMHNMVLAKIAMKTRN